MEANPRGGEGESWWLGLSPGFNHSKKVPNPMTQLILFSFYYRLSWNSFPFILKRSKTNTKFFLMSRYIIQQLAYAQPSALDHFGYTAHIYILLPLEKVSAAGPYVPCPLASLELSTKPWGFFFWAEKSGPLEPLSGLQGGERFWDPFELCRGCLLWEIKQRLSFKCSDHITFLFRNLQCLSNITGGSPDSLA